jgi:hypothetical protein
MEHAKHSVHRCAIYAASLPICSKSSEEDERISIRSRRNARRAKVPSSAGGTAGPDAYRRRWPLRRRDGASSIASPLRREQVGDGLN